MKTLKLLLATIVLLATTSAAHAQSDKSQRTIGIKTQKIKVLGTCDMNKRRIEIAAYKVDGIKSAVWSLNTQSLTITYSVFEKDAPDNVQKTIASLGNDTEKYKAMTLLT